MKLSQVIALWDILHQQDTGELGFSDLEKAIDQEIGVENDICASLPVRRVDYDVLVRALLVVTKSGKLRWHPTGDQYAFLAALLGERTFVVRIDTKGQHIVTVRDSVGVIICEVPSSPLTDRLYALVHRGIMQDESAVESTTEILENL